MATIPTSLLCDEIRRILPSLEENALVRLMEKFSELGVESIDDLSLLQEKDLEGVIKPIQIRKILTLCGNQVNVQGAQAAVTRTSSSTSHPSSPSSAASMSPLSSSGSCPSPIIFENKPNTDPNWAQKLEIPLVKMGRDLREPLQKGKRLAPEARRKLVRIVVDEVRGISSHATKSQFATIAKKFIQTFPTSLEDRIDGTLIGSGYDSFMKQLMNRNDNLNRPVDTQKSSRRSLGGSPAQPEKKADCYGCVNYAPSVDSDDVDRLESVKQDMCEQDRQNGDVDWHQVEKQMRETYCLQRKDINMGESVKDLMLNWPFLFTERGLFNHFQILVGLEVKKTIYDAFITKAPRLCKFFENEEGSSSEMIKEARLGIPQDNIIALLPVNILAIMRFFAENEDVLFLLADETSTRQEIERADTRGWPRIVCLGKSILEAKKYMVVVDGQVIIPDLTSFLASLSAVFAVFYVLNIQYQEGAAATLEFIQRCFLGINPDRGTKTDLGRKRKATCGGGVNSKVLRLINRLANFEWTFCEF